MDSIQSYEDVNNTNRVGKIETLKCWCLWRVTVLRVSVLEITVVCDDCLLFRRLLMPNESNPSLTVKVKEQFVLSKAWTGMPLEKRRLPLVDPALVDLTFDWST